MFRESDSLFSFHLTVVLLKYWWHLRATGLGGTLHVCNCILSPTEGVKNLVKNKGNS